MGLAGAMIPIGVDVNLRGLGLGFVLRRQAREALKAVAGKARKYCMEVAVLDGYVAVYGYLEFGVPSFEEYVAPMVARLVEKYAQEVRILESLGIAARLARPKLWGRVPEADALAEILERGLRDAGLRGVPPLFNRELDWLVRKASRRWEASYKFEINRTCQKVAAVTRRLLGVASVVVKLEDLATIHGKAVRSPRTRRWCYAYMQRALVKWLPPGVRVGYVRARYTSTLTPCCGARARRKSYRELACPRCGRVWHRDAMAALNIALAPVVRWLR